MRTSRLPALSVSVFAAGLVLGGTRSAGLAAEPSGRTDVGRAVRSPAPERDWPVPAGTLLPSGAVPFSGDRLAPAPAR